MKTSLLLCLGVATAVMADYRPVGTDAKADYLVPGKFYLRVLNTAQAALEKIKNAPKAPAEITSIIPSLHFAELDIKIQDYDMINPVSAAMKTKYPDAYETVKTIIGMEKTGEVLFVSPDHKLVTYGGNFVSSTPQDLVKDMGLSAAEAKAMPAVNTNSNWGLQFLADRPLTGSGDYGGMGRNGAGVDVYIVGIGIDANSPKLKGRVEYLSTLPPGDTNGVSTAQAHVLLDVSPQINKIYDVKATATSFVSANDLYKAAGTILANVAKTRRPSIVDFGAFVAYGPAGLAESNIPRFLGANGNGLVHPSTNSNMGLVGACAGFGGSHGSHPYISSGGVYPNGLVVYSVEEGEKFAWSSTGPCNHVMAPAFNIKAGSAFLSGPPASTAFTSGLVANVISTYSTLSTLQARNLLITGAVATNNYWEADTAYYPNYVQRAFNLEDSCRSIVTAIPDSWCRGKQCVKETLDSLCELNAKNRPSRQCLSLVAPITDRWCQATGCDAQYASLCAWKCTA